MDAKFVSPTRQDDLNSGGAKASLGPGKKVCVRDRVAGLFRLRMDSSAIRTTRESSRGKTNRLTSFGVRIVGAILAVLLLSSNAFSQTGFSFYGQIVDQTGKPAPFSQVRVCAQTGGGSPCNPLSTIYSDPALTHQISNPVTTDSRGNYNVFVASGYYILQFTVAGSGMYSYVASAATGSGGANLTPNAIQFATSTTATQAATAANVVSLFTGAGPCFLKSDGTCTNVGSGGNLPSVTGTSQFANAGATAFFSGGVVNSDAIGGIAATIASSSCVFAHCAVVVPPTSTDTTIATVFSQLGLGSSFLQDLRANANGQYFVNPGIGFNAASLSGSGQAALPLEALYTEPSPTVTQGIGQTVRSSLNFFYAPGYSLGPDVAGCPLGCPNPPHTGAPAAWASHSVAVDFVSFNGSGINNTNAWFANAYGTGDFQGPVGADFVTYMGGWVAPSDEGAHMLGSIHAGNQGDYQGTLTAIVDANHIVTSTVTANGTQGQGRFLMDQTTAMQSSTGSPLVLIDTTKITAPGVEFPYGTVQSTGANFFVDNAEGTLTNDCTVPIQEGGVAIGQNSGVNGCQVTVTSGTFDTISPVCMAQNKWNLFDIGIKLSAATALSGGHQTITGTMHRSVTAGAYVFQGKMCGAMLVPQGDGTHETDGGLVVQGSVFPIVGCINSNTCVYVNYQASQVWAAIPNNGSQWGSTATDLSQSAKGLQASSLVRTGGVVNGFLVGAGVSSSDRWMTMQNTIFFTVSGCSDTTFNGVIAAEAALTGPFPNNSNPNQANISYAQAGADSTCSSATIVPINHQMSFYPGAEVYDIVNHATGTADGTMAVSWQPLWTGHTGDLMDSPPHYAVNADVLNILNEFGTPGNIAGSITLSSINRSAVNGSKLSPGAVITYINSGLPNETLGEGGQGRPTGFAYILGYAGSWIEGTTAPGPGNFMLVSGKPNQAWVDRSCIFQQIGLIGLDKVGSDVKHAYTFDDCNTEFDWSFNFSRTPTFGINPNQITARAPIVDSEYRFGGIPFSGNPNGITRFAQTTPVPSASLGVAYQGYYPSTAVVTQSGTPGATQYQYMLFFNDSYGLASSSTIYLTLTGNATLSGSNFNNIPCIDLPAGATNGQIRIYINPVTELVGTCTNSSTVVHDTGTYTDIRGNSPFLGGQPLYSGAFVASSTLGGFLFSQPDVWGTGGNALTITAGISQTSAGVLSVDTTAIGNGLGTINAAAINVGGSPVCTVATGCTGSGAGFTLTTTGTSGAATLSGTVLNIPNYSGGSGSVTSVGTTGPLTGGPITTTGTIGCPTCVTSASALGGNALMIGGGSQTSSTLGSLGTTTTVLHGNVSGPPSFGSVVLSTDVSGSLSFANLASLSANTVLGALTATTPSGLAMPSCSTGGLGWTPGTGFGCNTFVAGSGTNKQIPVFTAAGVIGNSHIDDGGTTASTVTVTENFAVDTGGPVNTFQLGVNVFSALPTCNSGNEGTWGPVTDSSTATWGATITGGSTNHVLAYCDGSNWTVMGK